MSFEEYCRSKKIDPVLFSAADPQRFGELSYIFEQVSPASFTQQKLFIINDIRRMYKLPSVVENKKREDVTTSATSPVPVAGGAPKPAFKPKFK